MPFLSLVHIRPLTCVHCGAALAGAGARSFIVDAAGDPVSFAADVSPQEILVQLSCPNGHATRLRVPADISAEETLNTPEDAPFGVDARLMP